MRRRKNDKLRKLVYELALLAGTICLTTCDNEGDDYTCAECTKYIPGTTTPSLTTRTMCGLELSTAIQSGDWECK